MERIMRSWWTLAATAALILALLANVGLPMLFPALGRPWVRLALIALVAIGFGLAAAWRWWRARKASAEIADDLTTPSPDEAEGEALVARMRAALAQLKDASHGQRDYLYVKPWYLIIGPPGAGKTTALVNSGIRFPWSDTALGGVGGTRNLDFWFADEAVLVDTAGRYTIQDADAPVDAAGWDRFLHLLRRTRPLQPINGVLVAIGLDELMAADRDRLDAYAVAVRRRLGELRRVLGVTAPVYLIFSKADLLAGFDPFFADLDAEGRRAVLGATLPLGGAAGVEAVATEFDRMVEAVWSRSAKRLQEEPDQRRRSLILGFPAQLASLRARVVRFIDGACPDGADGAPMARGFYFTSGTQDGAPFDRVLSAMAAVYEHEPALERGAARGRAYFLNRLLTEVVFPEAGLVQAEPRLRRRRRMIMGTALGAMGALALALVVLWGVSFSRNKALQTMLLAQGQGVFGEAQAAGIDLAEVRESDADLEQALPVLDRLRALPRGFAAQGEGGPPWSMRAGLYQSGDAEAARQAYLEALQRILLPRILLRLERVLHADAAQPAALYESLKAYLMLGGYGPLDRQAVRAWVEADWRNDSLAGEDRADVRARLARHLDAMLADPDLGRVWAGRKAPLDGALVAQARAAVQTLSLADRAYAVLRQRASTVGADWRADRVLASGDAQAFRNGGAVLQMTVPWFFTADGYRRAYQAGLSDVQSQLDHDLWVLGPDAARASIRDQLPAMRAAVARDYAQDYIKAWDGVLAMPQAADYFTDARALGAFTRKPSPLKTLLIEVRRNTVLGGGAGGQAGGFDAGRAIRDHFAQVADFTGASASTAAPVDDLVQAIRQAASATAASNAPGAALGGGVQGQVATALGGLSTAGVVAPPQLQGFVSQATQKGRGAATRSAQTALNQQYAALVRPVCLSATQGRYPFAPASSSDAMAADIQRVYGMNGQIDGFVRDRLQPLLDTGATPWRWRPDDPVAGSFAPSSAAQLQKAAAIRDLVAGGLALNVSLVAVGSKVDSVEIAAGGTSYRIDKGDRSPHPLIWTLTGLPQAHVISLSGTTELSRAQAQGTWALFRLIAGGAPHNDGPSAILVSFGSGASSASLVIQLPTPADPFGRGGPFSFHCPERL